MKILEKINTCPYPGLRSFTEEESLYFKGRDLQIDQIASLLEQNKFLMVTGASGEGKSSLLYAGLIPNARAGFFKARYSNWVVASFRPERSPVSNLSASIAEQFNQQASTVETELRRGFSSLIDLYTSSEFYAGNEDQTWEQFSDKEKKERKRKAANLLIIVDQFEEFFTNPENFYNETPSGDSQIVVNLVLETARIAIKRNLPVYVVCTMRSDYIGQCSAFRGLPEYIGFSQFFVPRLKRKDLKQVIEEPAMLSGNRISQRLIERLVFDIAEGVDQLPILQHALSQIWLKADYGNEEMDLIHYSKTGGMPADDLPDEDKKRFLSWFSALPEYQQHFYSETGLGKVIEIHANTLYENAWESYNEEYGTSPITKQEAKRIVAMTFSCLTKIDNSRAVRNRMTLAEIASIINSPKITPEIAGNVINIYRKEGNSFIHPFITEDPATRHISSNTVLDITHESLIRNWNKLNIWASKEFEFYSTYLDFKKQLERWKLSGKGRGYLLPLGPLSYFENWYKNCKPNAAWIMRYTGASENPQIAKKEAEEILSDTREFLKRSAQKEMVSRAFMKYGPRTIATVFAILAMLVLSGFYWYDADQKKNANVLDRVRNESFSLLKSQEIDVDNKSNYLLTEERFNPGSMLPYLEKMQFNHRVELALGLYKKLILFTKSQAESPLRDQLFELISRDLNKPDQSATPEFLLSQNNKLLILLAMDNYYDPTAHKNETLAKLSGNGYQYALQFFSNKTRYRPEVPTELNMAIQMWLTFGHASEENLKNLLALFSPLGGNQSESVFNTYYAKGSFEPDGRETAIFNGGYHTLASLYAALGEIDHVEWSFQQILTNKMRDYFELARVFNNHLNVIGYLYQFGHHKEVPELLKWITANTADNPQETILRNIVIRSGYISNIYPINFERNSDNFRAHRGYLYPNLYFGDRSFFDTVMIDYDAAIRKLSNVAERNFNLAMNDKRKAMFYAKYCYDRNLPLDEKRLDAWLKEAIELYSGINKDSLEAKVSSTLQYNGDGVRTSTISRKNLFIYPDYRDGWFSWSFHTNYFFHFLEKNNLLGTIYKTGGDLQAIHFWVAKAFEWRIDPPLDTWYKTFELPDKDLTDILSFVDHHPEGIQFDKNLLYLVLANRSFARGDSAAGMKYYAQLNIAGLKKSADRYEYVEQMFCLNMIRRLCGHLAELGNTEPALKMMKVFPENNDKVETYTYMAKKLYEATQNPTAFVYLDSAYTTFMKTDYSTLRLFSTDSRNNLVMLLSEIGSNSLNKKATTVLLEIPQLNKSLGVLARVTGVASEGNYYLAYTSIPSSLTETEDLECRTVILMEACKKKEKNAGENNQWKAMDHFVDWSWNYIDFKGI
jgi:energy-coupling factor transporter ATP-binding protein EcfA2